MFVIVECGTNPYQDNVQGKANELITVAGLLERAGQISDAGSLDYTLEDIYDRLEENVPRIAIIGGSPDHPAHILDLETALRAAAHMWERGAVPFFFSVPVVCDATAQSSLGMSYSLQSRNAVAEIVVNQMEAHAYHGAYVVAGCDKTPLAIVAGLAHLDRVRQRRGDAPVVATFNPSHVLRGGTMPIDLVTDLELVAQRADTRGYPEIAFDLREAMKYTLLCTTDLALQGVLTRAQHKGLVSSPERKAYERRLAVHTCDPKGGICAFNGTGNSSRHAIAALGLAHPTVELLTEPADVGCVNRVVDDMFRCINKREYSVGHVLAANFANAVRIYSATGGSTNLMMHMVAAMIYAGYDVDVWTIDQIRRNPPVPDIFNYSLTEGRDIFALAQQCCAGAVRGIETVFYELIRQGIPMDVDAPTVTSQTWRQRLADTTNLSASGVTENPIILCTPRRPFSGVEVLRGNFFETAVLKVSGMTDEQIREFDDQVGTVLCFASEEEANVGLLDVHLLNRLKEHPSLTRNKLLAMAAYNYRENHTPPGDLHALQLQHEELFDWMVREALLKVVVVVGGQGPEACGMPEMLTPTQHINANRELRKLTALISDGRFSGVTYGAAVGHVTPEALNGGLIGLLETGDLLHIQLTNRRIDLIDPEAFVANRLRLWSVDLFDLRSKLGAERHRRILVRQRQIAATNRMHGVTDASKGVVPRTVAEEATRKYSVSSVVLSDDR